VAAVAMSALAFPLRDFDPIRDLRHRKAKAAREVADWLAWLEIEGKAPRTLEDYERTAAVLLRYFPCKGIAEFTDGDVLHVLKRFPAGSRRKVRAHLASLFRWAYRTGRRPDNVIERVPSVKAPPKRVVPTFSEAEQALLTALPSPDGALMLTLLDTGLRKGEARRLLMRHVNFDRLHLVVYRGKGDKDRVVPMTTRLATALDELFVFEGLRPDNHLWYTRPGGHARSHRGPIGEGSFHRWYERTISEATVAYRKPHTTRHTFALNWLRRGGRLETLSLILGHESIKTTMDEYGHLDMTDVARDLALVER
jgi:integrase